MSSSSEPKNLVQGPGSPKSSPERRVDKSHTMNLDALRHLRSSPVHDEELPVRATATSPRPPKTAREKSSSKLDPSQPFSNYQDTSMMNARRHNTARTDTFNTPSKLQKDLPTRVDKQFGCVGDMPFNDLLWICEQSFRKEAATLGKEVLAIARAEFTNVSENLMRDVRQPVEDLSAKVVGKVGKILEEVEGPAKVDWMPLHDEFSTQRDQLHFMQQQFNDALTAIRSELQELHKQHEQASSGMRTNMQQLRSDVSDLQTEVMRRSERQVTQVLNLQQSLVSECTQVTHTVQDLKQEVQVRNVQLNSTMEAQLTKHVHEKPVNVDFAQVTGHLERNHLDVDKDLKAITFEVCELKSDLHKEFLQKFDLVMGQMEKQRAATIRLQEEFAHSHHEDIVHLTSNLRDTGAQTEAPPVTDRSAQTEGKVIIPKKLDHKDESARSRERLEREREDAEKMKNKDRSDKIFQDGENLKKKARQALMKPQYNVHTLYKDAGWAQAIAKNWMFENFTFLVIFINSIWIAVDIDNNEEPLLINAAPIFQVVEHFFCLYFTFELAVRFIAFKAKRDCINDAWFIFDAFLVLFGILETWVVTIIVLAAGTDKVTLGGDLGIIRMFRLVKMVRLSRLARLLASIPELLVLLKAVGAAVRSMLVFFLMWLIVIYVFAVVFRQLTEGQDVGRQYFNGVPAAMNTLLIEGILPENLRIMTDLLNESVFYWPLMVCFILLTSITLMYMLIGVLTDVIHFVATSEKEGMVVSAVANRMRTAMRNIGRNEDIPLSKMEFQELLVSPEVVSLCSDVGVNVIVLVDMSDVIYESCDKEGKGMSFECLVEVVLNMRGTNPATVKDVKEQLRVIKGMVTEATSGMMLKFGRDMRDVNQQLQDLRKALGDDEDLGTGGAKMSLNPMHFPSPHFQSGLAEEPGEDSAAGRRSKTPLSPL